MSLVTNTELLEHPDLFMPAAVERAKAYLSGLNGNGVGAYSNSQGVKIVREEVAEFIANRDGLDPACRAPPPPACAASFRRPTYAHTGHARSQASRRTRRASS